MEKFQESKERAIKHIKAADHILTQTYPHIRDPKLLLAALDNVYLSMDGAMSAMLQSLRDRRKIGAFHDSYTTKLDLLQSLAAKEDAMRDSLTKEHLSAMKNVHDLISSHKESAVEFARKDALVISTENYSLKLITPDTLKGHIRIGKLLITAMERILTEND